MVMASKLKTRPILHGAVRSSFSAISSLPATWSTITARITHGLKLFAAGIDFL